MSKDEVCDSSRPYECYEHDACSSQVINSYFSAEEHVYDQTHGKDNRACMIRWKSGKRVDPRLLTVLESFRKVYVERRDFFKRIFPGVYDEFVDVFKKIGDMILKNKEMRYGTMNRSLSFGSLHDNIGHNEVEWSDHEEPPLLEKFKVRTPVVIVAGSDTQDNKTNNNPTASG